MTAPVGQARAADDRWTIRFFMPSKWSMDTLPTPDDDNVALVDRARRDGGGAAVQLAIAAPPPSRPHTAELVEVLRDKGIETAGEPVAWFYDPPWTLPFRRRNEIAVPVKS